MTWYNRRSRFNSTLYELLMTLCMIAILAALLLPPRLCAATVTVSGQQFTQSTNAQGQIVLTPVAGSVEVPGALSTNSFLQNALAYFSSFNTNSTTFINANYQVFTGVKFQSGINEGALLGVEAQPFTNINWLTFRDVATLADTVGTVSENEFDIGAFFVHYDLRFGAFAGVDTIIQKNRWTPILGLEAQKALTANSFMGVAVERRIDDHDRGALTEFLEAGFTF
jgi:hypothetical protein